MTQRENSRLVADVLFKSDNDILSHILFSNYYLRDSLFDSRMRDDRKLDEREM